MSRTSLLAEKILVADDDRTTRFAVSSMLKKAGYAVTAAKDCAEALRNIQQTSFDLVFLDIWMPKLTGLEVLARVRAGESHPKIIIMTADGTPETLVRAIREQAYEYLSKPFPPKEAVEVAERALKQNASPPIRSHFRPAALGGTAYSMHAGGCRTHSIVSHEAGSRSCG